MRMFLISSIPWRKEDNINQKTENAFVYTNSSRASRSMCVFTLLTAGVTMQHIGLLLEGYLRQHSEIASPDPAAAALWQTVTFPEKQREFHIPPHTHTFVSSSLP